jgi:hypothetical protein
MHSYAPKCILALTVGSSEAVTSRVLPITFHPPETPNIRYDLPGRHLSDMSTCTIDSNPMLLLASRRRALMRNALDDLEPIAAQ